MIWKYPEQNMLFPKGLNWVQHWVSRLVYLEVSRLDWDKQNMDGNLVCFLKVPSIIIPHSMVDSVQP